MKPVPIGKSTLDTLSAALNGSAQTQVVLTAFAEGRGLPLDGNWRLEVREAELVHGTTNPQTGQFTPDADEPAANE